MHFWRMQAYRGALLVGMTVMELVAAGLSPASTGRIRSEFGFDLFATCDGSDWWAATRDGFGDGRTDFGIRTMAASPAGPSALGTTNDVRGAAVYRSRTPPCAGRRPRWPAAARVARTTRRASGGMRWSRPHCTPAPMTRG